MSSTGVAGLTLGGGSGWLERKHGLTCDNVLAVELVTADGELVRASETEHADLFWALRGGGGNFGVVTAFELALHPVGPEVMAGLVIHPAERGRELLALYRDVMNQGPDELSLAFVYLTAPAEPEIPEALRGRPAVAIAGMYAGPIDEAAEALRAIREYGPPAADLFEPMPYAAFQSALDDPPGYRNWWTAEHLTDLHDGAIDAISRARRRCRPVRRSCSSSPGAAPSGACPRRRRRSASATRRSSCTRSRCGRTRPTTSAVISWARAYRADLWPLGDRRRVPELRRRRGRHARARRLRGGQPRAAGPREGAMGPGERVPRQPERPARGMRRLLFLVVAVAALAAAATAQARPLSMGQAERAARAAVAPALVGPSPASASPASPGRAALAARSAR